MGMWGVVVLLSGAIVLGVIGQSLGRRRFGTEWLLYAAGAEIGGFVASERLGGVGRWGWEVDGLSVFPALVGALIGAGLVEVAARRIAPSQERAP